MKSKLAIATVILLGASAITSPVQADDDLWPLYGLTGLILIDSIYDHRDHYRYHDYDDRYRYRWDRHSYSRGHYDDWHDGWRDRERDRDRYDHGHDHHDNGHHDNGHHDDGHWYGAR